MKGNGGGERPRTAGGIPSRWQKGWAHLNLPLKVGILVGLLGAVLAAVGLVRGASEPFSWRGLAMAIVLAGGSWGLVSWALTTAVTEANQSRGTTGEDEEGHSWHGSGQRAR